MKEKKDVLELEGVVLESMPNANFRVQLDDTDQVRASNRGCRVLGHDCDDGREERGGLEGGREDGREAVDVRSEEAVRAGCGGLRAERAQVSRRTARAQATETCASVRDGPS